MKKLFVVTNVIMLTFILIFDMFYMASNGLLVKAIASLLFVVTGLINLMYCIKNKENLKFPIWMIIALTIAMLGDILINLNFYLGTIVFGLGHVFYFASYCMLDKMNRKDFLWGMMISLISLMVIFFTPFLNFGGALMQGICGVYAVIISFMLGKAISNSLRQTNMTNLIIVIGSLLFFISDFMLMLKSFADLPVAGYLCLGTYYPAQFLLAFSLFVYPSTSMKFLNHKKGTMSLQTSYQKLKVGYDYD